MTVSSFSDADYQTLAGFRRALRGFTYFSEQAAESVGLTPQQHQALLAVRAENGLMVGELAERMMVRPHSATGLADRLTKLELLIRQPSTKDRRQTELVVTDKGEALLHSLSESHRAELRRLRPLLSDLLAKL
jgi:DNA-binding MarR family transcriptional regulator